MPVTTTVPRSAGYTLATTVDGNVPALHTTATWLTTVSDAAAHVQDMIGTQLARSQNVWTGAAADRCRDTVRRHQTHADQLATAASEVGTAVSAFATEIDGVKAAMRRARAAARQAGYLVTADAIHLPMVLLTPGHAVIDGVNITATVDAARQREARAHANLTQVLSRHTTFLDFFTKSMPARAASAGRGLFTTTTGTQWYQQSANARARAVTAAAAIADHAHGAVRIAALHELTTRLPGVAADDLATTLRGPLTAGPIHSTPGTPAGAFWGNIHYSGGLISGAGIGLAIANGTPADKAVGVGASSWAAGALASGGAAAGLTALGVSAGPVGWVALGVGLAVSTGVGYLVDHHWDDITHGADTAGDWIHDRTTDTLNGVTSLFR